MNKTRFCVTGMSCAACSARVDKAVRTLPEVRDVNVNLLKNEMTVTWRDAEDNGTNLPVDDNADKVVNAVTQAGYGAFVMTETRKNSKSAMHQALPANNQQNRADAAARETLFRLWVSALICIPLMYLAMAPMAGLTLPQTLTGVSRVPHLVLTQFLLTIIVVGLNFKFFRNGFKALIQRAPNMDSLVALGSGASVVFGLWALFQSLDALGMQDATRLTHISHNLYFDSAAMILTLITVGKYFEAAAKTKTTQAVAALMRLVPDNALVVRDGKEITVAADDVVVGETVILKTGMRVPVDGVLINGVIEVDESSLTGESIPVQKQVDDALNASGLVAAGHAAMRATKVGRDTALAQIIALVDEATSSKAPVARLADRISAVFVPVVIGISAAVGLTWLCLGYDWEFAATVAVSVLVISCPCALGLATPTAIMVGMGKGAQNGILIKSAEVLESCGQITTVVLDKTGTVTAGKPVVTNVIAASGFDAVELLRLCAAVEMKSEHALARAVVECAQVNALNWEEAQNFEQTPGAVTGVVSGRTVSVGNRKLVEADKLPETVSETFRKMSEEGKTVLVVKVDDIFAGLIAVADAPKADSRTAVEAFKAMELKVLILTGDNERTARAVGACVGADEVIAEVMPQDKASVVKKLQAQGQKVLMIGDGVNDAPALVTADIGMAIGAGTDVALECADVVLMRDSLVDAVRAVVLSKAVMRNIRQNLFWAFFYNCAGIPVAAGVFYFALGWLLNPMIAAAAMSMSSVSVVTNALRLRNFKYDPPVQKVTLAVDAFSMWRKPQNLLSSKSKGVMKMKKVIEITGMMCKHCTGSVTKKLSSMEGVTEVNVSLEKGGYAEVVCDETVTDEMLKEAVESLDFEVRCIKNA